MADVSINPTLCRRLRGLVRCLPLWTVKRLAAESVTNLIEPGSVIFYRGHVPYGCHLLISGQVALDLGHSKRLGHNVVVRAPVLFGYMDEDGTKEYPATARAITPALISYIESGEKLAAKLKDVNLQIWTCEKPCT